jgi:hypothetical protein
LLVVAPGGLREREVLVARDDARVRAIERGLSLGAMRYDPQVQPSIRPRGLGVGERAAPDKGGQQQCQCEQRA